MNNRFRLVYSIITVAIIIMLLIDFFILDEFKMEPIFLFSFSLLLLLNLFRFNLNRLSKNRTIYILSTLIISGFICFNFYLLTILSFGIGFTGRDYPATMSVSLILNVCLSSALIFELKQRNLN